VFDARVFNEFARWLSAHSEECDSVDYHDWLLYAWMREHRYLWFIDPWPSMLYRQHDANQLGANAGLRAAARRLAALAQPWYFTQVLDIAKCLRATGAEPIATLIEGSSGGLLRLALHGRSLRRSPRDAAVLRLVLAVKAITGVFKP
jgi:rhamnosyltransferase